MKLIVQKITNLTLLLGIIIMSAIAMCHSIHSSVAPGLIANESPRYIFSAPTNMSGCCLLKEYIPSHSFIAGLLARTSGRFYFPALVIILLAVWYWQRRGRIVVRKIISFCSTPFKSLNFLQEAFSQGILHSRIYEPALLF